MSKTPISPIFSNYFLCGSKAAKYLEDAQRKLEFGYHFRQDFLDEQLYECGNIMTGVFIDRMPIRRTCGYLSNDSGSRKKFFPSYATISLTYLDSEYLSSYINSIF